ncbi:MAG: endonuclease [Muribaculaceae bacterium]|jgi:Endonuclease I|nr:endonuclease [Muribaculaceae bacterium]
MIARLLGVIAALLFSSGCLAKVPEWAVGLCGEALKEAVRVHCGPVQTLEGAELWHTLLEIDGIGDGKIIDRFGVDPLCSDPKNGMQDGITMISVIDRSWWMPDYALLDVYANDLHVIYPCDESIHTIRKNYMPGVPEGKIFYDGASWKTGEDVRGQGVWSFPEKYAGEIARAIMYVACIYPADLWVGPGAVFMDAGKYPSLSESAVRYLLVAHDSHAPEERELIRNKRVAELQGNINPFVVWPDMLAHIWGELKNVPYPLEEDCNDDFKPLRGYYRIDDGTIDLVSPFVPDDAEWKVDGVAVYNKRIPIKDLVPGKHEITFTSARCSGKVVVSVLY